jgi:alpha-tubulin suppressor-like RCC1 family protein
VLFRQISAFEGHTCGVTTENRAYCWGYNVQGQVGDGTKTDFRDRPVAVAGGHLFRKVSVGVSHTCGVTTSDQAFCWGENRYGQLGDGTTMERLEPVRVTGGLSFRELVTGTNHTCGLAVGGRVYCWGDNAFGQLGSGTAGSGRTTPGVVARTLGFRLLSAGSGHTCGIASEGRLFCWGLNTSGQLGAGTLVEYRTEPTRVRIEGALLAGFTRVGAGRTHTCGVTNSRRIYCWGDNSFGALGHGTTGELRFAPVIVVGDFFFDGVDGGMWHTCGFTRSSRLKCWGRNEFGQLGNGTTTGRSTPGASIPNLFFRQVTGGAEYTCGVALDDRAYCWGDNRSGQLGDGSTTVRLTPTLVVVPS